jgi:hypothetical protein
MLRNGEKACYSVYVESRGAVMDKALQARVTSGNTNPGPCLILALTLIPSLILPLFKPSLNGVHRCKNQMQMYLCAPTFSAKAQHVAGAHDIGIPPTELPPCMRPGSRQRPHLEGGVRTPDVARAGEEDTGVR